MKIPHFARRATLFVGIACAFAGAAAPLGAAPVAESQAMQYLRSGILAPRKVSYIGEVETIRFGARRSEATIVRVEHRPPNYTRRSYLAPPALFGDSVVARGDTTYEFDEHRHRVTQGRRASHDDGDRTDRLALIEKNYRAVVSGETTIAGRSARIVTLLHRATGRRMLSLWLDTKTNLPLEREKYHMDGSIAFRMRFTSIRYQENLPIELFAANAPNGYSVSDEPAPALPMRSFRNAALHGADKKAPTDREQSADGLTLIGETQSTIGGVGVRHLLFSDGIRSVSLFESPLDQRPVFANLRARPVKIGDTQATFLEDGNDGMLTWDARNACLTLVGDGNQNDLIRFAEEFEHKQQ